MTNVVQADREKLPDFPYTPAQLRQIAAAVRNEAYPPQGRAGIGSVRLQDRQRGR